MDGMDEIRLRMRISNLEAQLALREIERDALTREIKSPWMSFENKDHARERLSRAQDEWHRAKDELEKLSLAYPEIRR
jgi:hypothetical protein